MKALRIKLSVLWTARMLSGLQGDSTRLHDPEALTDLAGGTSAVQVTNELLLIMSLIFALFDLAFLVLFSWPFSYETVWSIMYLVFTALVAWYAWKWPGKEMEYS